MTTRIALVGASGKLGQIIHAVIDDLDGFEVTVPLRSGDDLARVADADLVVDATAPGVSEEVVRAALAAGRNVLVATSGWSAARIAELRPAVDAAGVGVVIIPNFSLGSVVGTALAVAAGRFFDAIEIVEAHRDTKADSPSGTAVRTAELISAARATPVDAAHVDQRARGQQVDGIPVHALRRPGVIARQEVLLSGPGETLSIIHDTTDSAAAYAPGIRLALAGARDARGIIVGLDAFLALDVTIGATA